MTGKTHDCFVEIQSSQSAQALVSLRNSLGHTQPLRDRNPTVEMSSLDQLLENMFIKARSTQSTQALVNLRNSLGHTQPLRDRNPTVEMSSLDQLLENMFIKARSIQWSCVLVWCALSFLDNPLTYTYTFNYTLLALYPKPKLTYRLNNFIHPSASEEQYNGAMANPFFVLKSRSIVLSKL